MGCTDFHYLMYRNRGWAKDNEIPDYDKTNDPMKIISLLTVIGP